MRSLCGGCATSWCEACTPSRDTTFKERPTESEFAVCHSRGLKTGLIGAAYVGQLVFCSQPSTPAQMQLPPSPVQLVSPPLQRALPPRRNQPHHAHPAERLHLHGSYVACPNHSPPAACPAAHRRWRTQLLPPAQQAAPPVWLQQTAHDRGQFQDPCPMQQAVW